MSPCISIRVYANYERIASCAVCQLWTVDPWPERQLFTTNYCTKQIHRSNNASRMSREPFPFCKRVWIILRYLNILFMWKTNMSSVFSSFICQFSNFLCSVSFSLAVYFIFLYIGFIYIYIYIYHYAYYGSLKKIKTIIIIVVINIHYMWFV